MPKIQRALISVFDKKGLIPLAQVLAGAGVELISTGGTARALREAGLTVKDLSDHTGFPEMLDGRVKTLHPKIHGGLLYIRGKADHEEAVRRHDIQPIDLVVVNLYPFEQTIAKPDVSLEEAIENIDIGGPSMLRSAAKNHQSVTVVIDPSDYQQVAGQIQATGETTLELRRKLAARVFARTSAYDASIAAYLIKTFQLSAINMPPASAQPPAGDTEIRKSELPETLSVQMPRAQALRYGENPHQQAALYGAFHDYFEQLHGKALSYNNILDLTAAARLMAEFTGDPPTLAILKHTNPCGAGQGQTLREAWDKALATDRQAPFGGIIAVNRPLDAATAGEIGKLFAEVVIAPDIDPAAQAILADKKNLRLLVTGALPQAAAAGMTMKSLSGGFLLQTRDAGCIDAAALKVVTKRTPTAAEIADMVFAFRVAKHVKSNAIVYARDGATVGIGAGQMSRVDSARIAAWKAREAAGAAGAEDADRRGTAGSVVASDAFFPFADGLMATVEAGATAVIQPGGSMRDNEVIAAADAAGIAMVFTGLRHFRH